MAKKPAPIKPDTNLVLELSGISRSYETGAEKLDVLRGVSLNVQAGESLAIVGPSGSGKSTLLHIMGLLDSPTKGHIKLMGQAVEKTGDEALTALRNRHCGFVYQHHHLLREFSALENVVLPALLDGGKVTPELQAHAEELLKKVGLGHRVNHLPSQLSGGEQQRVAIARALMNRPSLLLADEPTGNLDPHTAESVADLLFGLMRDTGMAAVLVTHNMQLAERCSRILTMGDGVLKA